MKALIATVIVIGRGDRVDAAAGALDRFCDRTGVRRVLISEGNKSEASPDEADATIRLDGLSPDFVDNAVAWLRLSSLPAVVWWRGGSPDTLARLAPLVDRLVLDTDPADEMWRAAPSLFARTAVTDLHWGALTRWRSALAHLFDLPHVRGAVYRRAEIDAADAAAARLFAGWLRSCLPDGASLTIRLGAAAPGATTALSRVRLTGDGPGLTLRVHDDAACLDAEVDGAGGARIVPLDDGSLEARFAEEIRVRTRDAAFERALAAAMEIGA